MIPQVRPDQMSPMQLEMLAREFDGDVSLGIIAEKYKGLTIASLQISLLSCPLLYRNNNPIRVIHHPKLPCLVPARGHRISNPIIPNSSNNHSSRHLNRAHLLKLYKFNSDISKNNWRCYNINNVNSKLRQKLSLQLAIRHT
jgi:hypothetical protein